MSFSGHAFDMISRLKQNSALIKSRRVRYQQMREEFAKVVDYKSRGGPHNDSSGYKDIERIKEEIRNRLRAEKKKAVLLAVAVTAAIALLSAFFILRVI